MLDKIFVRIILNKAQIACVPFTNVLSFFLLSFLALVQPGSMKLDEGRLVISHAPAVHTESFE